MNKILTHILLVLMCIACNNRSRTTTEINNDKIRIVSLTPSITKDLISLGLKDNIVGATSYCQITQQNKNLIVGSVVDVNIEKILLLKPDIVFVSRLTKEVDIQTIKSNGIDIYYLNDLNSFEDICSEFMNIARKVKREEIAQYIIENTRNKIDSLRNTIPYVDKKLKVFFQLGTQPLYTVIPNTYMNDYITYANCENIAQDLKRISIRREKVLASNPDIIFIVSMGNFSDSERDAWNKFKEINAIKNNKIFILNSDLACTPSLESFTKTMEIIIDNIYH